MKPDPTNPSMAQFVCECCGQGLDGISEYWVLTKHLREGDGGLATPYYLCSLPCLSSAMSQGGIV